MMLPTYPAVNAGPAPLAHPEVAELWNAIGDGRFCLQRCRACGTVRFPPAPACWRCLSTDTELEEVDGPGTVAVAVVVEQVTSGSGWSQAAPYRCGLVDIPGEVRVPGRIFCDCGQAAVAGTVVTPCRVATENGAWVFAFTHSCVSGGLDAR
jgi:uncharacterized OB-fold protein